MGKKINKEDQEKIKKFFDKVGEENYIVSEVTHRSCSKAPSNSRTFSKALKGAGITSVI